MFCKNSPGLSKEQPMLETTGAENPHFTPDLLVHPAPFRHLMKVPLLNYAWTLCLACMTLGYVTGVTVGMSWPVGPLHRIIVKIKENVGRKYLQYMELRKDSYPESIKNS